MLDVIDYVDPCISPCVVPTPIDPLALEHAKEAFNQGVIGTAAHGTHTTDQVMAFQKALVLVAGELAAAVRMQDDRRTRRRTEGREDTANPTRARRGKPWRQPRASLKPHVQAVLATGSRWREGSWPRGTRSSKTRPGLSAGPARAMRWTVCVK